MNTQAHPYLELKIYSQMNMVKYNADQENVNTYKNI
jgi:hypothetical protein